MRAVGYGLVLALLALPVPAEAQLACSVSTTGVNFGRYDATSRVADDATGSVTVVCNTRGAATLAYSVGLIGTVGPNAARDLSSGAGRLAYQLYRDPARTEPWADTAGEMVSFAASLAIGHASVQHFTVYGRIPPRQSVPPGAYQDEIVVTLTY